MRTRSHFLRGAFLAGCLFTLSAARAHEPGGHAHMSFSAGEPGDPSKQSRTIEVVMGRQVPKMYYRPNRIEVRRGEQIRFVLKNADHAKDHEFVLATAKENLGHAEEMKAHPNMQHHEPNAKRLRSKETNELLWRFTKAGEFEFSCNLPGHREAGMVGKIVVK